MQIPIELILLATLSFLAGVFVGCVFMTYTGSEAPIGSVEGEMDMDDAKAAIRSLFPDANKHILVERRGEGRGPRCQVSVGGNLSVDSDLSPGGDLSGSGETWAEAIRDLLNREQSPSFDWPNRETKA